MANNSLKEGKVREALTAYYMAVGLDFDNSWFFWYTAGNLFKEESRYNEAITAYQRAIELNPNLSWCSHNLGHCLENKDSVKDAIQAYLKATELYPDFRVFSDIVSEINQKDIETFGYTYEEKTTNTTNLKKPTLIANQNPQKSSQIRPEEVEVLDKYIKDNNVVFDLGANLGAWSWKVLENKKNVNLHLFEASPYTYQSLLQNMANYIEAEKLFLNQFAISSQDSFQAFYFYENHPTLSGIYRGDIKLE